VFTNKVKDAVMTLASWGPLCLRVPVRQKERKSASGSPLHNFLTWRDLCEWKWRGAFYGSNRSEAVRGAMALRF